VTGGRGERLVCLVVGLALGTHLAAWPRSPVVQLAFLAELVVAVLILALPRRRRPMTARELNEAVEEYTARRLRKPPPDP
jgi:predicted MFS family arabinose efflux permease